MGPTVAATVAISNVTLQNGRAQEIASADGGAVGVGAGSTFTATAVSFTGNQAAPAPWAGRSPW